ncbi:ribosome maturation factor RimM [Glycomyces terrestris]|uniref:Ribosome maturation factor RimM n=1 Tax=Glycomyces terrestris TaxID=2493553 RepID=A0A426UTM8_9ACTN|nr:ribosome maturation factor RimM [Glycomyces terrestris]RRR97364.1 ribosome maturation factor RimM [Glycomyces terrestris]
MAEVVVGRIVRPHGLRGELVVEVRTDDPEARFQPGVVYATKNGPLKAVTVRWHQGRPMIGFEGVPGRTEAEALRGVLLSVDVDEDDLGEDEFRDDDLVGLAVVEADGNEIGPVARVEHGAGHETLVVKRRGTHPARIPFVAEMVTEIDFEAGTITVDLPPGLLEL